MNQKRWIINKLNSEGRVSRNEALDNYITRLGAYVHELKNEGWVLEGRWEKTAYGKDYVYEKTNRHFSTTAEANRFLRSLA